MPCALCVPISGGGVVRWGKEVRSSRRASGRWFSKLQGTNSCEGGPHMAALTSGSRKVRREPDQRLLK